MGVLRFGEWNKQQRLHVRTSLIKSPEKKGSFGFRKKSERELQKKKRFLITHHRNLFFLFLSPAWCALPFPSLFLCARGYKKKMVEITWGQLVSPNAYLGALRNVNVPRATCFLLSTLSARRCCGRSMSSDAGGRGGEEALVGSAFVVPAILFAKEFFVGSADSRRKALLGLASPVVAFIVRLRWTQKLTASEVVQLFAQSSSSSSSSSSEKKKKKGTSEKISLMGKIMVGDEVLVNAFSALVLAASVVPEDLREASFLPGGPVIRVFSEKYKFDVDAVQLPKLNMPKVGNFFVFDVYSEKNETLFGGRGQGFKYNLFLTPRYVTYDLPVYAYKQFKESKLAKAKCIVKSQKYGFELDLIETFNPFTLPQRLFFRASKVVGKVGSVAIAKPAQMAQRQFVRTVLRREPREPRQLTFLERLQVMLGLVDVEEIANEPESPRSSLLPFSKPETQSSRSASKNGSKRGSKANSKAASGRSTPFFGGGGGGYDEDNTGESNKNDKKDKNKKDGKKKDSDDKVSSSSVSKKNSNDNTAASSASDLTQLLPRLKSFSEIKEDVDSFFQGTPEEQAARNKTQEEAKKKLDREQKKKQKELAQKRERELKEQKKKTQEEEKLREKAEAEGRRMVEVNDSYFNRYVPDVAETLPFKAPTAVEGPKK